MKTFGKIIICIIVIATAIGMAYLLYTNGEKETNNKPLTNTNTVANNSNTNSNINNPTNQVDNENIDYIGEEENKEEETIQDDQSDISQESIEQEKEEQPTELTGKDKAIDIVKKQYAMDGQTVRFDHMEGEDYIIKINEGTAVTWYLVDGTTWEAEEY